MGEKAVIVFIVLVSIMLLLLLAAVVLFLFRFRKSKIAHEVEVATMAERHKVELLNEKLTTQGQTMEEFGKELHDNLGQKVTLASIYLQSLEMRMQSKESANELKSVNGMMNEVLYELRMMSKSLVNHDLLDKNLSAILESNLEKIKEMSPMKIFFHNDCPDDNLNISQKNAFVRIVQEFVNNSIKHSNGTKVDISLTCLEDGISLICEDNGMGFSKNAEPKGIGLSNMKRRAIDIGASLDLTQEENKGVKIEMTLKLNTKKDEV